MSRRVQKTHIADRDIDDIALWIARGGGVGAALKWYSDLDEKLKRVAEMPGMGTDQGHLHEGMRSSPFGAYLVFYKRTRDGILVVRVLHGARDFGQFFK